MLTNTIWRSSIPSLSLVLLGSEGPYSAVTARRAVYEHFPPGSKEAPFSHAFGKELIRMQATPFNTTRKREELKAQRNRLFKRFLRNPQDTGLALKIKIIDDQVAAFAEQMEQESKAELSSMHFLSDHPIVQRHHGPNSKKPESGK
jgi:hypothetical protein